MSDFITFLQGHPDVLETLGVIGFLTYIAGFKLVQTGYICGNGIAYSATNVVAAVLVLLSLVTAFNLASFLIQVSYIGIGLYGIAIRTGRGRLAVPAKILA